MEVTFEQNIERYDVAFNQNVNEFTVDIVNETIVFESVFASLGERGFTGDTGKNTYQIAVENGYLGTVQDWLNSLREFSVKNETPIGLINGANASFTSQFNFIPESVEVFLNGLIQQKVIEFQTIGDNQINLNITPNLGELILINYIKL